MALGTIKGGREDERGQRSKVHPIAVGKVEAGVAGAALEAEGTKGMSDVKGRKRTCR
jgi:hypothetical protein